MTFDDVPLPDMPEPPAPEHKNPTAVWIHFDGMVELEPSEVFPDGIPEEWSVESVRDIMSAEGYGRLMTDWGLMDMLEVYVAAPGEVPLLVSP